jgi:hypothetical protein
LLLLVCAFAHYWLSFMNIYSHNSMLLTC